MPISSAAAITRSYSCECQLVVQRRGSATQYMRLGEFIVHSDLSHLFGNDLEGHNHVREDNLANFFPFFEMEALGIDDAHLLQNRGLPGFAGT